VALIPLESFRRFKQRNPHRSGDGLQFAVEEWRATVDEDGHYCFAGAL